MNVWTFRLSWTVRNRIENRILWSILNLSSSKFYQNFNLLYSVPVLPILFCLVKIVLRPLPLFCSAYIQLLRLLDGASHAAPIVHGCRSGCYMPIAVHILFLYTQVAQEHIQIVWMTIPQRFMGFLYFCVLYVDVCVFPWCSLLFFHNEHTHTQSFRSFETNKCKRPRRKKFIRWIFDLIGISWYVRSQRNAFFDKMCRLHIWRRENMVNI